MTGCTGGRRRWIILSVRHTIIHPHISHTHTVTLVILISRGGIVGVYLWCVGKHRCLLSRSPVRCLPIEFLPATQDSSFVWPRAKQSCTTHRSAGFMGLVHCQKFQTTKRSTTLRQLYLFPSSREWRETPTLVSPL
jgi:hypothetical protein